MADADATCQLSPSGPQPPATPVATDGSPPPPPLFLAAAAAPPPPASTRFIFSQSNPDTNAQAAAAALSSAADGIQIGIAMAIGDHTPSAAAIHTPPAAAREDHWRPKKKSTKGMIRLKVVKDKFDKPPRTESGVLTTTPTAVGKSAAKRKLDFDDHPPEIEIITVCCFTRAELMENLRLLAAKINLWTTTTTSKKRKRMSGGHDQQLQLLAIVPVYHLNASSSSQSASALVPIGNNLTQQQRVAMEVHYGKKKKSIPKVLGLDEQTLQVYDVLTQWDKNDVGGESFDGVDIGGGPYWDGIRRRYEHMVDYFIATVEDLLGPRKFSRWGGSVIDSVVGTYLTQNVADILSSDAFLKLAAKFPGKNIHNSSSEECSYVPLLTFDLNQLPDFTDLTVESGDYPGNDEGGYNDEVKEDGQEYNKIIENFIAIMKQENDISTWDNDRLTNLVKSKSGKAVCATRSLRTFIATTLDLDTSRWDKLRLEAYEKGYIMNRADRTGDSVDWEAVLHASTPEVAKCIAGRGQHYLLTCRIQAFLARMKKDHGSFDLDWLRYVSRERAKDYLLSVDGLGPKSVDCIRLLSLEHKAFPVDVNVARIVTRLGWVELQKLPYSAEFHSVNLYPIMQDVQKYLWPRLCTIDKEKLYKLHCLMITFGKVICTKINPNCSACPFRAECKYYNSSFRRASLPAPGEEQGHQQGTEQITSTITSESLLLSNGTGIPSQEVVYRHQIDINTTAERQPSRNCEPIIEVPPSPEYDYDEESNDEEQTTEYNLGDIEDFVPGAQYDDEINLCCSNNPMADNDFQTPNYGKDLVLTNPQHTSYPSKKLKNIGRLRTEHHAYVLPDDHAILEEFEERVPQDPCPYLLVVSHSDDHMVKGTILIPCRTATRGNFPLNGTYFQDHEVFADYASSRFPITIPREYIWNLERRIVYFGSSIHSITKGQTKQDIEDCFKKGYICVRGFDRRTRYPMRLCASLHVTNRKKESDETKESDKNRSKKKVNTSPHGESANKEV